MDFQERESRPACVAEEGVGQGAVYMMSAFLCLASIAAISWAKLYIFYVYIYIYIYIYVYIYASMFSRVRLGVTLRTVALLGSFVYGIFQARILFNSCQSHESDM